MRNTLYSLTSIMTPYKIIGESFDWGCSLSQPMSGSFYKKEDKYVASLCLAGTPKSEIDAEIEEDVLKIKTKQHSYVCYLPDNLDKDSCSLKYEDGILTISLNEKKKNVKKLTL